MEQKILTSAHHYQQVAEWAAGKKILLVNRTSLEHHTKLNRLMKSLHIVRFQDFQPNPLYESVKAGLALFRRERCNAIISVGGGSAMDVAKCIKLFSGMEDSAGYLEQPIFPNAIPFLSVPTTAGSGSEATRYAVVYHQGQKQSVSSEFCMPDAVLLDPTLLDSLSLYQRKATMMDAFSHALESFWSVNSTEESGEYSRQAMELLLKNARGYLENMREGNAGMLLAAHSAGKAINITQTTAGHAMCYKITSLFGCSHGHAAILCNRVLFPWMLSHMDRCVDPRGEEYLKSVFQRIAVSMNCGTPEEACQKMEELFQSLFLDIPSATRAQFDELKTSVNPVRLKNHPIRLDGDTIDELYHIILRSL